MTRGGEGAPVQHFGVVWAMIPPASLPRGDEVIVWDLVLDLCWLHARSFATLTTHRALDPACAVEVFTCPGQFSLAEVSGSFTAPAKAIEGARSLP